MAVDTQRLAVADKWREKLKASNMVTLLIQFVEGKIDMQPHRAQTIVKLMGKFMPDLQAVAIDIHVTGSTLNRLELEARANILGIDVPTLWNDVNNQSVIEHESINQDEPDAVPEEIESSVEVIKEGD